MKPSDGSTTHDVQGDAHDHALSRRFQLRVVEGPDAGAVHAARGERVVIGTHESAELRVTDRTVSRFHCELAVDGGQVHLRDLSSRNGTEVDGVRVLHAYLRDGATLTLGHTRMRFELAADHVRIRLSERDRFGVMVGHSRAMRAAFAVLERAAASDATVLLEGETGSGKEAAAESLHRESPRAARPFVVVDCGAIPRELLESELFGHERGAFTGAVQSREGAFAAAAGGTVFLDEVGELSGDLQPKLLRALERREIKPVGSNTYRSVDVRLIAATNRNLRAEVNERRFRSDLYYRLAVIELRLPPMRERMEDLPLLVEDMLGALDGGEHAAALRTPEFYRELRRHRWPGNVRELRNYLERCLAMRETVPVQSAVGDAGDAPAVDSTRPLKSERERWTRTLERRYLEEVLAREGGNVAAAARAAGIDRIHFYRLLWKHGLR
jgi:two-component system, NtrC family, response regulator GlrR